MKLESSHKKTAEQFTKVFFEKDIKSSVKQAKEEIKEILERLKAGESFFTYNGQINSAKYCDFPRLLMEWGRKSRLDHSVRNIILSSLLSSEEKCQGTALMASFLWTHEKSISLKKSLSGCTYEKIENLVKFLGGNGMASSAVLSSIRQGSLGCLTTVEETKSSSSFIKSIKGTKFWGSVDNLFGDKTGREFRFDTCYIIAVRGTVESIASIHNILEISSLTPVVIMAEGFLPDVSNSMAETFSRNRGNCIPFVVKDWPEKNFLDLESKKIQCVSSERGDTFLNLKLEKSSSHACHIFSEECLVEFSDSSFPNKIEIHVSQSLGGITGLAIDRIKILLGFSRLASRTGVVSCQNFFDGSDYWPKNSVFPSQSLAQAEAAKQSLDKILQDIGCLITV